MTSSTSPAPDRPRFVARGPEDVLALVPVVLGFVPSDSVVMLTFGAQQAFHARVDLPEDPDSTPALVDALLGPAVRHRVRRVVLVVYSGDARGGTRVARSLARAFARAGIDVAEALRADGERWYAVLGGRRGRGGVPEWGVPYDVSAHPFLARAVVEGLVTHASRDELARTLAADPGRVAAVEAATGTLADQRPSRVADGSWVRQLVSRCVGSGEVATDAEVARLLHAVLDLRVRDAGWCLMTRESAGDHVRFWTDVVRRAPLPLLAAPAALLGFAAWLAGQGALAWCALDRCAESDPDYSMADLLGQALTNAVPPSTWQGGWDPGLEVPHTA